MVYVQMIDDIKNIDNYLKRLFPITRSITGNGNRKTLKILQEIVPLNILEYPTNQKVYDWSIPKEWNIKDAWIKNSKGEKIIDFKISNIHVVSYSKAIHKKMKLDELNENLHYLSDLPEAIPYRTNYYKKNWGFCVSYNQYKELFNSNEEYEVFIDSSLYDGSLSIGELLIEGKSKKEHLVSCYICHPSMANDSLSGVILTAFLSKYLLENKNELERSYRIVFIPETIGAIAYLSNNEVAMKNIDSGFVVTTVGGNGKIGYKQSFDANHEINKIIEDVFIENKVDFITYPFDIRGSDERQYSSQGFRINTATITKDKYYEYDYYHTSLDNLAFVKAKYINESLKYYKKVINIMDKNVVLQNNYPNGEVMLGKHDLYPKTGGALKFGKDRELSEVDIMLWLLFYCDGKNSLYKISRLIDLDINILYEISNKLVNKNILSKYND
jgi:aminopeptidase-like protein